MDICSHARARGLSVSSFEAWASIAKPGGKYHIPHVQLTSCTCRTHWNLLGPFTTVVPFVHRSASSTWNNSELRHHSLSLREKNARNNSAPRFKHAVSDIREVQRPPVPEPCRRDIPVTGLGDVTRSLELAPFETPFQHQQQKAYKRHRRHLNAAGQ